MVKLIALVLALLTVGCGNEPPTCMLDRLPGKWLMQYVLVGGTCGPIAGGVVEESGDRDPGDCTTYAVHTSQDRCMRYSETDCPNGGNEWRQHWIMSLEQVGEDWVEGVGTVEATWGNGQTCQGTYNLILIKAE